MKKKVLIVICAVLAVVAIVEGVMIARNSSRYESEETSANKVYEQNEPDKEKSEEVIKDSEESLSKDDNQDEAISDTMVRPGIMSAAELNSLEEDVEVSVPDYSVEGDFDNIINKYGIEYMSEEARQKLKENLFVVYGNTGKEFFEVYESNRYASRPDFVTVDSLLHIYHMYFAHLQKNTELNYLNDNIKKVTENMLLASISQYDELKGSEWENAAKTNVTFFATAAKLLEIDIECPKDCKEWVNAEYDKVMAASGIERCLLTDEDEDYSQYTVRSYYEGNEELEKYFRAMMWYGRIHFIQKNEKLDRSAMLMTLALNDSAVSEWESVYTITSFFAGSSDDNGFYEYIPVIESAYGKLPKVTELKGDTEGFDKYHELTAKLKSPAINSSVIDMGEDNIIPGYRFMGQRFSIDAEIMQNLIYSCVKENENGDMRMLPNTLDVPAALGSDIALEITNEAGAKDFPDYAMNMDMLRSKYTDSESDVWTKSLYSNWLNMIRPLTKEKTEGYPKFMQSKEWAKKDLETFAGSYTELKHDTVLYSKQVMAEMGGGMEEEIDDRGYVQPEPTVYARFAYLSKATGDGLKNYNILSASDEENLNKLTTIANTLLEISKKELKDETLTDGEYDFIREYGGNLEHLWYDSVKDEMSSDTDENYMQDDLPSAICVDVATDPNGQILELATGSPSIIYVVVRVDGKLKVAFGSVYDFYEFTTPLENRMTDTKWRYDLGISPDESGMYIEYPVDYEKPSWTDSYRVKDVVFYD